jgi:hypothetical protein
MLWTTVVWTLQAGCTFCNDVYAGKRLLKHEWNRFPKSSKAYFLKWLRINFRYEWEFLSAACEDAYYHLFSLPLHSTQKEKQRPDFEQSNFVI